MAHYLINTNVVKLECKSRARSAIARGIDPVTGRTIYEVEREDIGWFVLFENSHEWLFLGFEKPQLEIGQQVTIRIEPK